MKGNRRVMARLFVQCDSTDSSDVVRVQEEQAEGLGNRKPGSEPRESQTNLRLKGNTERGKVRKGQVLYKP